MLKPLFCMRRAEFANVERARESGMYKKTGRGLGDEGTGGGGGGSGTDREREGQRQTDNDKHSK